jgi:hypothetical protein
MSWTSFCSATRDKQRASRVVASTIIVVALMPFTGIPAATVHADAASVHVLTTTAVKSAVDSVMSSTAGPEASSDRVAVDSQRGLQRITNSSSKTGPSALAGTGMAATTIGVLMWAVGTMTNFDYKDPQTSVTVPSCGETTSPDSCRTIAKTGKILTGVGVVALAAGIARLTSRDKGLRQTGYTKSNVASFRFANKTPYPLRISLEGVAPRTLTVPPGASETIEFEPGQYAETVEPLGGEADAFHSLRTYAAGVAYSESFHTRR